MDFIVYSILYQSSENTAFLWNNFDILRLYHTWNVSSWSKGAIGSNPLKSKKNNNKMRFIFYTILWVQVNVF